jgi:hypothetical protein
MHDNGEYMSSCEKKSCACIILCFIRSRYVSGMLPNADPFLCICRVVVKSLSEKTNIPLLAGEIVEKCKLIHPSKVRHQQPRIMHSSDSFSVIRFKDSCASVCYIEYSSFSE